MGKSGGRSTKGAVPGQLTLRWVDLEQYPKAVCCHGVFLLDTCMQCLDVTARSIAEFEQGVTEGRWDREGFTPAERRALEKGRIDGGQH